MRRFCCFVLFLSIGCPSAPAAAAEWRWPVRGPVVERFAYRDSTPFAAGQRRGIEIGASPGAPVRSACDGRVSFAGSIAGSDEIVSVACGGFNASYLHLGGVEVSRGDRVAAGDRIGSVGLRSRLYFGVRRSGRRWEYVDPLSLLPRGGEPRAVPLVPARRRPPVEAPLGPAPWGQPAWRAVPRRLPALRAVPVHATQGWREPHAAPQGTRVPIAVWVGLGLLTAALPGWGVRRSRRRRRRASAGMAKQARPELRAG